MTASLKMTGEGVERAAEDRPYASWSWLHEVAIGALSLALMVPVVMPPSVVEAAGDYRSRHFALQDVCPDGLSWTNEEPLRLPQIGPRDSSGVPMHRVDGKLYYRPGALAINGMKRIDAFHETGNGAQLNQAIAQAARLRAEALVRRRAWWLPFWYDYLPAGQRAPWFNAMTQGLVLSFFVRLYRTTGDEIHLTAARRVFHSFVRLGRARPTWVAYVDSDRYLWLEHYPLKRPDHVLNAHLHAIFGLYEYWQMTRSPDAREILEAAITTMKDQASRFRRKGTTSLYGLRHRTARIKYHQIHVWQFKLLAHISGDPYFLRFAKRLSGDVRPIGHVSGRPSVRGPNAVSPSCRPRLATDRAWSHEFTVVTFASGTLASSRRTLMTSGRR